MFKRIYLTVCGFVVLFSGYSLLADQTSVPEVYQISLEDVIISPVVDEYITKSVQEATDQGAEALLIQLDTPGGLLSSTRTIVKSILGASIPVIVYVSPNGARAGSAGVFITLSAHVAAMAPSTNIGAAHPVSVGGNLKAQYSETEKPAKASSPLKKLVGKFQKQDSEKNDKKQEESEEEHDPMSDKILNDTIAWVKAIAKQRGRNVEWAVKSVKESASITADEALKNNVIDLIADDVKSLLEKIDGKKITLPSGEKTLKTAGARVVAHPMSQRQEILSVLINPNVAYIFMMLGMYGLLFEITHPGSWIPGIVGLICLIVAFYAFQTIPTNYAGLGLILIAFILFIAEAFVTSFGLLTLGGVVCMVLGSLFLIDSPFEFMQVSLKVVVPFVGATAAIAFFLVSLAVRAQRQGAVTGVEGHVGGQATAASDLNPSGKIFFSGEYWDADSEDPVKKDERVEIIKIEGMRVKVKKSNKE
jgi:membrane-bound serine protease (ClpP class)